MIDSVVDLFEEHVDLGGSQFSESIIERWYFARISQRNVVVLEFGSPCRPRSHYFIMTQIVMINNGSHRSLTKCFISNGMFRFHEQNVFENYLAYFLCLFHKRVSSFSRELDLELVGSIGNF